MESRLLSLEGNQFASILSSPSIILLKASRESSPQR